MPKVVLATVVTALMVFAHNLRADETVADQPMTETVTYESNGLIDGGLMAAPPLMDSPLTDTLDQAQVISGNFIVPGTGMVFRLHHTAGEQFGLYPSTTSIGGTRLIPFSDGVWLLDGQLLMDNHARLGGSFDSMWRWSDTRTVWGIGVGADLTSTDQRILTQGVISLEMLRESWGLRANAYLPFDTEQSAATEFATTFALQGTNVAMLSSSLLQQEAAMGGIDFELYRNFGVHDAAEAFAGSYAFESKASSTTGVKLGVRGNITDDVTANLMLTQDDKFETNLSLGLTWFFGPGQPARRKIDRRLTSLVRRNHYVSIDRQDTITTTSQIVNDQTSGDPLHVFFASEGGAGVGTQNDPTNIAAVLGNANFGSGSVLVLMDQDGPLTSSIALTADRQQVLGSTDGRLAINLADTSGQADARLALSGLGNRPVLEPSAGSAAIRLSATGFGHVIRGLTLDGSGGVTNGISDFDGAPLAVGASNTRIEDMVIRDFTGTGVLIRPSTNTTIDSVLFQNNGVDIDLNAANTTLRNLFSFDSLGDSIRLTNATGNTTIEDIVISDSAGTALTLSGASDQVTMKNLNIARSGDAGVDVVGGDAEINVDSRSAIVDTDGAALRVQGGTSEVAYDGNIIQGSSGAAVEVSGSHNGSMSFSSGTLAASSGLGLRLTDALGTYQFSRSVSLAGGASIVATNLAGEASFTDLFIDGSASQGIFLDRPAGLFSIAGQLTIGNAQGSSAIMVQDAADGALSDFGTTTITTSGAGTIGIDLANNDSNSVARFGNLNVVTADGIGLRANQGGTVDFVDTAPDISATGAAAIDLESTFGTRDSVAGWVFSELSSQTSGDRGVRLADLIDDFQVVGSTSITDAVGTGFMADAVAGDITLTTLSVNGASTGLDLIDHSGTFLVSGAELLEGSGGQIQNVDVGGRFQNAADATLRNVILRADQLAIEGQITGSQNSTISLQNSTIHSAGEVGVQLGSSAGSTGELDATLWNNEVTGQIVAIRAAADGGDIELTTSENELNAPTDNPIVTTSSGGATVTEIENENTSTNTSTGWIRDDDPQLVAGSLGSDGKREFLIADPDVIYDSATGTWHLYYAAARSTTYGDSSDQEFYIQHATSATGSNWVLDAGQALSLAIDPTAWDSIRVETPSVLIDPGAAADRRFKLFYSGADEYTDGGFPNYQLGMAMSADGSSFTRVSAAESSYSQDGMVLHADDVLGHLANYDFGIVADPEIKLIDGTYNLWFSSFAGDRTLDGDGNTIVAPLGFGISHATSNDGINWTSNITPLVASLQWPGESFGGQQPSVAFNSALQRWETYFTSDTDADKALIPSTFNPSGGAWRSTSPDALTWTHSLPDRDFRWDQSNVHEQLGLLTGIEVVIVDDVRHLFYTGWSPVDPPPGFVVPTQDGYVPAVLSLMHATRSAYED